MLRRQQATAAEYPLIMTIWAESVKQTHDFLAPADFDFYQRIVPDNLASVNLLLWFDGEQPVGFSGTQEDELVMLFLVPTAIGHGYGHTILTWLIDHAGVTTIDVNAQNARAKRFYLQHGFAVASTDAVDGCGKPYPIDHLVKQAI